MSYSIHSLMHTVAGFMRPLPIFALHISTYEWTHALRDCTALLTVSIYAWRPLTAFGLQA